MYYDDNSRYPYPYRIDPSMYNFDSEYVPYDPYLYSYDSPPSKQSLNRTTDYGPYPFVVDISEVAEQNNNYRRTIWTGPYLQLTLMSIPVGGDIGLEVHHDVDQFIRIEDGDGIVMMGDREDNLNYRENVSDDYAIIIPAGTWHNLVNTGDEPLKLYSIYAPPQHLPGTIHRTKEESEAEE